MSPEAFLGGKGARTLDADLARKAIAEHVAKPLGIDVIDAAAGIHEIVNEQMADLIRSITVGRGYDPRRCVMFAYGGAGPLHSYAFGAQASAIVVPSTASVFSAFGTLTSDAARSYQRSVPMRAPVDRDEFNGIFSSLVDQAIGKMRASGFADDDIRIDKYVTMRHVRQVFEVRVPCPGGDLTDSQLEQLYQDFETVYERKYGKGSSFSDAGVQVVTFGVESVGSLSKPNIHRRDMVSTGDASGAITGTRKVHLHRKPVTVDVYDSARLEVGSRFTGPAIIEFPITTVVVDSNQQAVMDPYMNIVIIQKDGQ